MNDHPHSSESGALLSADLPHAAGDAASAKTAEPAAQPKRFDGASLVRQPAVIVATVALVLLGWQWLETRNKLDQLHEELALRLKEGDNVAQEGRTLAKQSQETLQSLQAKMGAIDARLADSQNQQVALEAMYQELARNREDRLLLEVDQALTIAAQQLQLAGNVEAALAALQSIDLRLASLNRPQFLALRKALNDDMQRLKAVPLADLPGMALKLDAVAAAVDSLPLAFAAEPRPAKSTAAAAQPGFWSALWGDIWGEMKQLIRIERMDRADPGLLAPANVFFLRENLKLRLVNARLSLLQRDGAAFHEDAHQARLWLERYFDTQAEPVKTALVSLQTLDETKLNVEVPNLAESLAALRNLKVGADAAAEKVAAPANPATTAPAPRGSRRR